MALPLSAAVAADGDALSADEAVYISTTAGRLAALREEVRRLRDELLTLPDDDREILSLRMIEECSVDEIATRTGLGCGAIKHRVRRSLLVLSARLRDLGASSTA